MKTAAFFLGAATLASSSLLLNDEFESFSTQFRRSYANETERAFRQGVFAANMAKVHQMNAELVEAGEDPVHGMTKFMDLTVDEFRKKYLMTNYKPMPRIEAPLDVSVAADNVDWRQKDAVTPVKDQGQCGSCWAFSATEAIESYAFLAGQKLVKLSPQQINSCDKTDDGCNGGNTESAYDYVVSAGGIETEESYPYTSGGGATHACKFDKSKIQTTIKGYKSVPKGETALASALTAGPVSVCLAADAFQTYSRGVLSICPGQIDHCVQAVGYTADYWIVRNSWNTDWGEDGFIRIKRGKNLCKISNDVTYPTF